MWSLQYIFLRVAVPVFGTAAVAEGRALFAALFLLPVLPAGYLAIINGMVPL
jgi:hypothetical protein